MEQIALIRFGDFTLDGAQRRLIRAGQDVYLPPKTFELLLYLVRNTGRVIPKDELLKALWPGVNVVENTLAQRIREIREALGEGAHTARFIKTVPKVGYQFVAALDDEPANATAPADRNTWNVVSCDSTTGTCHTVTGGGMSCHLRTAARSISRVPRS